uniref:Uncharacterized protein n=1 Tax=viral metagenome TaxID=1070528 RepID=A0A6C0AST8_9ZZZZ
MCFSAESSILSFSVGMVSSILCILLGKSSDRIVGYFFGFISLMQLIDYLLWTHQTCDNYNKIISILGMILNHLQPIVLGFIVLSVNDNIPYKNRNIIIAMMIIYLIVIIPYSFEYLKSKTKQCTIKGEEHYLLWNWNMLEYTGYVYTVFITTFCIIFLHAFQKSRTGIMACLITIITYTTTSFFYKKEYIGTIWCYYSAFIPFIYYLNRCLSY